MAAYLRYETNLVRQKILRPIDYSGECIRTNSIVLRSKARLFPNRQVHIQANGIYHICLPLYSDWSLPNNFGYMKPAQIAPNIGANQNSHSCCRAHPPTNTAGPVLLAGLTDTLVTGIPIK